MTPPVFLSTAWRSLVMLTYEVEPRLLVPFVPSGLTLDLWRGRALVSLVGFRFLDTRLLGWRIPGHGDFNEVNLRFYVRREQPDGDRRGVVFLKEVAPHYAVAFVAKHVYNENYVTLPVTHDVQLPTASNRSRHTPCAVPNLVPSPPSSAGTHSDESRVRGQVSNNSPSPFPSPPQKGERGQDVNGTRSVPATIEGHGRYRWGRRGSEIEMTVQVRGELQPPERHSEIEFLVEHYWGYTRQRDGSTLEYRVEHPPWKVWPTVSADLSGDTAALYGDEFAAALRGPPCSALLADGSEVIVRRGVPVVCETSRKSTDPGMVIPGPVQNGLRRSVIFGRRR